MTENGPGIAMSKENNLIADSAQVAQPQKDASRALVPAPELESALALEAAAQQAREQSRQAMKKARRYLGLCLGSLTGSFFVLFAAPSWIGVGPYTALGFGLGVVAIGAEIAGFSFSARSGRLEKEADALKKQAAEKAAAQHTERLKLAAAEAFAALAAKLPLDAPEPVPFALSPGQSASHCLRLTYEPATVMDFGARREAKLLVATVHELENGKPGKSLKIEPLREMILQACPLPLSRPARAALLPPPHSGDAPQAPGV